MFFIRSASPADLEAVRDLLVATWHDTYDPIYGEEQVNRISAEWHSLPALGANLERPHSEFIVADDGRKIAGVAYASLIDENTVGLHQLYVEKAHQRQGVGGDLLAEIETCFDGARRIRAAVEARNEGAVAFYRALGFALADPDGSRTGDQPSVISLVFEKALPVV